MEQITFSPTLDIVSELPDHCDRCGAAAKLTCTLPAGELAFCGHHANAHAEPILKTAVAVRVVADFPWRGAASTGTTVSNVDGWQIVDQAPRSGKPYRNNSR